MLGFSEAVVIFEGSLQSGLFGGVELAGRHAEIRCHRHRTRVEIGAMGIDRMCRFSVVMSFSSSILVICWSFIIAIFTSSLLIDNFFSFSLKCCRLMQMLISWHCIVKCISISILSHLVLLQSALNKLLLKQISVNVVNVVSCMTVARQVHRSIQRLVQVIG